MLARAAELDEVPDDEEVAGEAELLDDVELAVDRLPRPRPQREILVGGRPLAVAVAPALLDDAAQVGHLAQSVGTGKRRQRRGDELEVERRGTADLGGQLDRSRVAGEAALLLPPGAQVGPGSGGQPRVELGEAAAGADGGEGGGQTTLRRGGVVGVGGGDATDVALDGELGEGVVAGGVERVAVVPQLDEDAVAPERLDQAIELAGCGGRSVGDQGGGYSALAAAGERPRVAGDDTGDVGEGELWCALLAGEVTEADRSGQLGVAARPVGEEEQVLAVRIRGGGVGNLPGVDLRERLLLGAKRSGHRSVVNSVRIGAQKHREASARCRRSSASPARAPPRRSGRCRRSRCGR